jgi:hypothetical protein
MTMYGDRLSAGAWSKRDGRVDTRSTSARPCGSNGRDRL